jgi:hypothetical protein
MRFVIYFNFHLYLKALLQDDFRRVTTTGSNKYATQMLRIMRQRLDYNVRYKQVPKGFHSNKGYLLVIKLLVT